MPLLPRRRDVGSGPGFLFVIPDIGRPDKQLDPGGINFQILQKVLQGDPPIRRSGGAAMRVRTPILSSMV